MNILVLEASTSAAKAMVYNTNDDTSHIETIEYPTDGSWGQQQDAQSVYEYLTALSKKITEGIHIDIIALITTWHSLLLCDRTMQTQSPVYLWSYPDAAELCRNMRKDRVWADDFYARTGCQVNASFPYFKLAYLRDCDIDISENLIADQGSYLNAKLTGVFGTTQCMASGSGLVNVKTREYDEELLRQLHIEKQQLPQIFPSDTAFPLCAVAAQEMGLAAGIPVLLAYSDGGANQVGAGALQQGIMTLSIGTSGAMRMHVAAPKSDKNEGLWCYRSPKGLLAGAATSGACNCINWARETLFPENTDYAYMEQNGTERDIPGFMPFLFGERAPGWNDLRTGGFFHLKPEHTLQDKYQAVQEGVLYNLYQCYERMCAVYGKPEEIRLSGGILHSEKWTQMCADVFGREITVVEDMHSSMMGGAVMAMEKIGIFTDAECYQPKICKICRPDPVMQQKYQKRYLRYLRNYSIQN